MEAGRGVQGYHELHSEFEALSYVEMMFQQQRLDY